MASMDELLQKIAEAIYGKDVRSSIHDGLKMCYDDGQSAKSSAAASAVSAADAKTEAEEFLASLQEKIDKGELNGKGLTVLGYYPTLDALKAAVTKPSAGDCYGVGTAQPYDIYVYDGVNKTWIDNGALGTTGVLPQGGTSGQMLVKSTDADFDAKWANTPESPVKSVNGLTGDVTIAIPTFSTLLTKETEWNQSFTTASDAYATLTTIAVPTSGLYSVSFIYSGMTSFANRVFITVGSARAGLPLGDGFPTTTVSTLHHYNAGDNITGQIYTLEGGTYSYQFARLEASLLQAD